jgi:hypothetical protein
MITNEIKVALSKKSSSKASSGVTPDEVKVRLDKLKNRVDYQLIEIMEEIKNSRSLNERPNV